MDILTKVAAWACAVRNGPKGVAAPELRQGLTHSGGPQIATWTDYTPTAESGSRESRSSIRGGASPDNSC